MARVSLQSLTDTPGNTQQSGVDRTSHWCVIPSYAARPYPPTCLCPLQCFLDALRKGHHIPIPDVLNQTFHDVDVNLTRISEESDGKMHSGCTAVTAFLRLEDAEGRQSFLPAGFDAVSSSTEMIEADDDSSSDSAGDSSKPSSKPSKRSKLKDALRSIGTSSHSRRASQADSPTGPTTAPAAREKKDRENIYTPAYDLAVRRVLYCANAGDARGVLCRSGRAVRLTYDHKGTDKQEAKRIMDAGGFVMSGRVNGVLAVTRSLGDSSMKEYVVGAPYTTETDLTEEDEFMILACDGVSTLPIHHALCPHLPVS